MSSPASGSFVRFARWRFGNGSAVNRRGDGEATVAVRFANILAASIVQLLDIISEPSRKANKHECFHVCTLVLFGSDSAAGVISDADSDQTSKFHTFFSENRSFAENSRKNVAARPSTGSGTDTDS
jgi:hypothetical protein